MAALKKQIFLVIESPLMSVVGEKRDEETMAMGFQYSVSEQGSVVAVK